MLTNCAGWCSNSDITSIYRSDSGAGFIRGDAETFAHADGVYYHVQMLNGASSNPHYTPPAFA